MLYTILFAISYLSDGKYFKKNVFIYTFYLYPWEIYNELKLNFLHEVLSQLIFD